MGREGTTRLGVVLFFVLSGFVLFRPFLAAYWFALAGSFVLLAWLDHPLRASVTELPVFLLFGQNYVAETAKHLDPPMWSLTVEVSFYTALVAGDALWHGLTDGATTPQRGRGRSQGAVPRDRSVPYAAPCTPERTDLSLAPRPGRGRSSGASS